ncbi:MAG: hypothetical protein IPM17_04255 [Verrucomicrobia bacterium]|nr:hypothetical protein [Verrucomicrobiota bacterium]
MKTLRTCPVPLKENVSRRGFLGAMAAGAAALTLEEKALLAAGAPPPRLGSKAQIETGKIGNVEISRLICGGNLIGGYAHSRDLIYVSSLLHHYFTDEKVMDTWQICEEHGINTMIVNPDNTRAVALFNRYRKERGGRMQWLAQASPEPGKMADVIKFSIDAAAVGVFLVGNLGDKWTFEKRVDLIGQFVELVRRERVITGVAGHSLEMVEAVEAARLPVDFYMKTLHHNKYWSARRPDQTKPVIENYAVDNYYDMDPDRTIAVMSKIEKPWIAYKVLAAGAIRPAIGFDYAFRNGADFACVGMFDFQVAEDVKIASDIIAQLPDRRRAWCA